MYEVKLMEDVKPILKKLRENQTEESEPLIDILEMKIEHSQEELQLKMDQMKMEIHRLSGL